MPGEFESGFVTREAAWHGLATVVESELDSANALKVAKLDWQVEAMPVFTFRQGWDKPIQCPDNQAVVRLEDKSVLGVVGSRYQVVQNAEAFAFFDGVVGEKQAIYHTAGSLRGGAKVWLMAKLPGAIFVTEKDMVEKYLLFVNNHDGKGSVRMFYTPVRVVCMNTLNAALSGAGEEGVSIRHTGNIQQKMLEAKKVLGFADKYYQEVEAAFRRMAEVKTNEQMVTDYLMDVFPDAYSVDADFNDKLVVNQVLSIAGGMNKTASQGAEDTLWNLYNASVEYADYLKRANGGPEGRLNSIWFGNAAKLKQQAFASAMALAKGA